ncbi:MAG: hypothetical protein ABUT39_14315 [Acidobacteriota bacterium]
MKGCLAVLRGYSTGDHLASAGLADNVTAWLTGQSSYRHSQLSPPQLAVLDEVAGLGYEVVRAGFPYNRRALAVPYAPEPLVSASLRNFAQFAAALARPAFAAEAARHLQPLLDAASRRLLLLCGSCGLQLFAAALPRLAPRPGLHIGLVAVGPVCLAPASAFRDRPGLSLFVVQGSRDWISRLVSRTGADARPPVDHLGYTRHPEARRAILQAASALART